MGNCNILTASTQGDKIVDLQKEDKSICHQSFRFIMAIGKGGFGMVWKVEFKKNKEILALKVMSKSKQIHKDNGYIRIILKKSVHSVMNELQILLQLRHSFIINVICAFQDRRNLYLGMEYLSGGDLRYQICKVKKFTETQTKFFIACIILALEYMHGKAILHRDIKPENLIFDSQGYLHVTDMGIARVWRPENSQDSSGTPGYIAPEVLIRQNHGIGVDYYALGVIVYECMIGKRPYLGRSRKEIRDQVLSKQVKIKENDIPENWSYDAADFVNQLLQRKPIDRLGSNGPQEVKNHNWFRGFQWNKLMNKDMQAPFVPSQQDNFNQNIRIDSQSELDEQNEVLLRRNSIQSLFYEYRHGQYVNSQISLIPSSCRIVPLAQIL